MQKKDNQCQRPQTAHLCSDTTLSTAGSSMLGEVVAAKVHSLFAHCEQTGRWGGSGAAPPVLGTAVREVCAASPVSSQTSYKKTKHLKIERPQTKHKLSSICFLLLGQALFSQLTESKIWDSFSVPPFSVLHPTSINSAISPFQKSLSPPHTVTSTNSALLHALPPHPIGSLLTVLPAHLLNCHRDHPCRPADISTTLKPFNSSLCLQIKSDWHSKSLKTTENPVLRPRHHELLTALVYSIPFTAPRVSSPHTSPVSRLGHFLQELLSVIIKPPAQHDALDLSLHCMKMICFRMPLTLGFQTPCGYHHVP